MKNHNSLKCLQKDKRVSFIESMFVDVLNNYTKLSRNDEMHSEREKVD